MAKIIELTLLSKKCEQKKEYINADHIIRFCDKLMPSGSTLCCIRLQCGMSMEVHYSMERAKDIIKLING